MSRKRTKNEVFTPYWVAKKMIHQDKNYLDDIFLEPSAGNGNFLVAILKEKLNKILTLHLSKKMVLRGNLIALSQIYGIELFMDNVKVARSRMLNLFIIYTHKVSKDIPKKYLTFARQIISSNIIQGNSLTNLNAQNKSLRLFIWGYDNSHDKPIKTDCRLYLGAKTPNPNYIPNYVIGNPPYDIKNHTKNNISYSQVFNYFVESAINLNPDKVSLIIPNRWFSGGKNLTKFRKKMLNDKHIEQMAIWKNSKDVFSTVAINGGVSYFYWNKKYDNSKKGIIVSHFDGHKQIDKAIRPLKLPNAKTFISDNIGAKIVMKLEPLLKYNNLGQHCSSSCPFTLRPYYPKRSSHWHDKPIKNGLKCYAGNHKIGYIKKSVLNKRMQIKKSKQKYLPLIKKYKLITAGANGIGISKNDGIKTIIAEPNSICTETYIVIGYDLGLNKTELIQLSKYLKTKLVRFLISLHKSSQHAVRKVYNFVPVIDFSNQNKINWNKNEEQINQQLMDMFKLLPSEQKHVLKSIHVK